MENITRCVNSPYLEVHKLLGRPYTPVANTTINEKFDVLRDQVPGESEYPVVNCFGFGIGGSVLSTTTEGRTTNKALTHRFSDMAQFEALPMVIRDLDNDLIPTERAKYALRSRTDINGQDYWVYWAKRIDTSGTTVVMEKNVTADGNTTTTEFVPSVENLSPEKPTLSNTDTTETSGVTITVKAVIELTLSQAEILEVLNACEIMYGDADLAYVSEIAVCTGVDRISTIDLSDGTTDTMNESISTQVAQYVKSKTPLDESTTSFNYAFDIGTSEPVIDAA